MHYSSAIRTDSNSNIKCVYSSLRTSTELDGCSFPALKLEFCGKTFLHTYYNNSSYFYYFISSLSSRIPRNKVTFVFTSRVLSRTYDFAVRCVNSGINLEARAGLRVGTNRIIYHFLGKKLHQNNRSYSICFLSLKFTS